MLRDVIVLALMGAAVSYARDLGLHRDGAAWLARKRYARDGHEVIDQWWQDGRLYTATTNHYSVAVNGSYLGFGPHVLNNSDRARYARMWVEHHDA